MDSALMQIGPGDVRRMLMADSVSLGLGLLLLAAGVLALGIWAAARRRAVSLFWLAGFAFLYGLRMLVRTATFRICFDVPPLAGNYFAAALTYVLPVPLVLFTGAMLPAWRRRSTWIALGLGAFAVLAIASDAALQRPDSAAIPNNVIAITFILGMLGWTFRPGLPPSRELRTLRVGVLAVSLAALADNLRGMRLVDFPGPDLEPFGFTVAVACLSLLAAWRVLGDARRLVALDRELSIARQIQASILPQAMPRLRGLNLAARYRPMTAVAGDFYDFLLLDEQRLGVLVADVSGHGVPAALIASMVKVALAAQQARADHPAAVLTGINETLCGRLAGQYVTAAYVFIDGRAGSMRYSAAGHPPLLHLVARGAEVREVEKNGLVLGFLPGAAYEELELPLEAGDRLLLYTDGLTEAANGAEELFGLERVKTALAAWSALRPDAAADALLGAMNAWSGQPARDDLTILVVERADAT